MCILFVDFKQAPDSADRSKLYERLEENEVPHKLMHLVRITMSSSRANGTVNSNISIPLCKKTLSLIHI